LLSLGLAGAIWLRKNMNRLDSFFFGDQSVRWKVYGVSSAAAFLYGAVSIFVFHRNEERASIETFLIQFLLTFAAVVVYVAKPAVFDRVKSARIRVRRWEFAAGGCAAAILVIVWCVGIRPVQAAAVNLRLRWLADDLGTVHAANFSDGEFRQKLQTIDSVTSRSSKNDLPVNPDTLTKTRMAVSSGSKVPQLSTQTRQDAGKTAVDLQSFAYTRMTQTGGLTSVPPSGRPIASNLQLNNANLTFQGDHTSMIMNGGEFIIGGRSTILFDSIDFSSIYSLDPIVALPDASVMVRNSTLTHVTQMIGRVTWVNAHFYDSTIYYVDGPIRLRDVTFTNCNILQLGPEMPALYEAISNANGQPITFVNEP
jgi:hypothetical protein